MNDDFLTKIGQTDAQPEQSGGVFQRWFSWAQDRLRNAPTSEQIRNSRLGQTSVGQRAADAMDRANSIDPAAAGAWLTRNGERFAWGVIGLIVLLMGLYALARKG